METLTEKTEKEMITAIDKMETENEKSEKYLDICMNILKDKLLLMYRLGVIDGLDKAEKIKNGM